MLFSAYIKQALPVVGWAKRVIVASALSSRSLFSAPGP